MVKISSSSGTFAKRGDPWVSDREGLKDYGRNPDTENPDFDRYTRAGKADKRKPVKDGRLHVDLLPTVAKAQPKSQSPDARMAAIGNRFRMRLHRLKIQEVKDKAPMAETPIVRAVAPVKAKGFSVYVKTADGEVEYERGTLKAAERTFERRCDDDETLEAELWSMAGDEPLKAFKR